MKKIFIFGAGPTGQKVFRQLNNTENKILGFIDNDRTRWGGNFESLPIYEPKILLEDDSYNIIIASLSGLRPITNQLLDMGIGKDRIITEYATFPTRARTTFLENLSEFFYKEGIIGSVAEGGVFQGDFAKEINRLFPNSNLYLFDTFEGFDSNDVAFEIENYSLEFVDKHFQDTSVDLVMKKMPHPEKVFIRKGYFPETTRELPDEQYCFVNLDFDLYKPIYAALDYFVPRMFSGGGNLNPRLFYRCL